MKLTIQRNITPINGARFGVLSIDGVRQCPTMENNAVIIPQGTYAAELYFSPHNRHYVIRLIGVPERSEIEIHIANFPNQLEGCIAVGDSRNDTQLINSEVAFDELMKKVILTRDAISVDILD